MEKVPVADIVCLLPDFQRQPATRRSLTAVTKAEKEGGRLGDLHKQVPNLGGIL